jgi:hypothetical protein
MATKPAVRFFKIKSTTQNNLWKGVRVNEDVGDTQLVLS